MAVVLIPQTDDGLTVNANCYHDLAYFKSYCDLRGYDFSPYSDDAISRAVIRGTDYLETRYTFPGHKLTGQAQATQWPRSDVPDPQSLNNSSTVFAYWLWADSVWPLPIAGSTIDGIDDALKRASVEIAFIALANNLLVNQFANPGGGVIDTITTKLDVLEKTVKYRPLTPGSAVWPAFPMVDNILSQRGLIQESTGRSVQR